MSKRACPKPDNPPAVARSGLIFQAAQLLAEIGSNETPPDWRAKLERAGALIQEALALEG